MTIGFLFALFPVAGVAAGLLGTRYRRAPIIAAGVALGLLGIYLSSAGIWAGSCWDCASGSNTREDVFIASSFLTTLLIGTALAGIWLGARLGTVLVRLRITWRELRDAVGRRGS